MNNATRSVWAPSCPFHCDFNYGEVDDPGSANIVVPANSTNTLGEASHWFIYDNEAVNLIDTANWPENSKCANPTLYSMVKE